MNIITDRLHPSKNYNLHYSKLQWADLVVNNGHDITYDLEEMSSIHRLPS